MKDVPQTPLRRADRMAGLELSEIVRISEHAARLRQDGMDVISLSTGEPDFPTPAFVIDAAMKAAFCARFLDTAGVAVATGPAYGATMPSRDSILAAAREALA